MAGKTGTARVAGKDGYKDKKYTASFMGIAPVSKPKFIVVVIIHEPSRKGYYAAAVAAPLFAKVMSGALRLFNIPTDEPSWIKTGVIAVKLTQLLKPWINDEVIDCEVITGIENDSRHIQAGDLFIAYPGAAADGRLFIEKAVLLVQLRWLMIPLYFPAQYSYHPRFLVSHSHLAEQFGRNCQTIL